MNVYNFKIVISSYKTSYKITAKKLIESLAENNNFPRSQILLVVGGYESKSESKFLDVRTIYVDHNSYDHTGLIEIIEGNPIKIAVPIKVIGNSPGVIKGGKMIQKLRKVTLKGLSENIPDFVTVDISGLDLGQTVKVNKLVVEGCEILNPMSNPVATIDIPRALRGKLTA